MLALANKVAIVTGASSCIGRATAKLFAEQGAKVIVAARRQAELDALVAEIADADGTAVALAGDVRDEAYAKALVDLAVEKFGGLDIAFNALLPGGTDTPAATFKTPESRAFVEGLHALKRVAVPVEIARSALYLASDASSFTTGTALLADGGVSINRT
jgi:NAD(P)-dependent dehydrogenase (short-subunit alcohol dehydrogenase family)